MLMTRTLLALVLVALAATSTDAQTAKSTAQAASYRAPRTESGHPDLQGVWNFNTGVPLQRPVRAGDKQTLTREEAAARQDFFRNALGMIAKIAPVEAIGIDWFDNTLHVEDLRTSLITYPATGRLPELVKGVNRMPGIDDFITILGDLKGPPPPALGALFAAFTGGAKNSYTDFMPSERCLFAADVPLMPQLEDNHMQIVQSHDTVILVNDFQRRVINLNAKAPGPQVRTNSGISRGRWEGDTLVVETSNFDGRYPSFSGAGKSTDKVVTERITRTAANRIDYSATVVDKSTFQDRIEMSFPMTLVNARIHEGGCHEGNYSMRNSLHAARLDDAAKAAAARETAAKK
jgi:hypothetical protein